MSDKPEFTRGELDALDIACSELKRRIATRPGGMTADEYDYRNNPNALFAIAEHDELVSAHRKIVEHMQYEPPTRDDR